MRVIYGIRFDVLFPYAAFSRSKVGTRSTSTSKVFMYLKLVLPIDLKYTRPEVYQPPRFEPFDLFTGPFRSSFPVILHITSKCASSASPHN
jgi:hypothetical protein